MQAAAIIIPAYPITGFKRRRQGHMPYFIQEKRYTAKQYDAGNNSCGKKSY